MTIGRDHAVASTGKIRSAKLLCCYIKRSTVQINPELVANVFNRYCILDCMDGTEDDVSSKKNIKTVKMLKVKRRLKMVKRMTEISECKNWEAIVVEHMRRIQVNFRHTVRENTFFIDYRYVNKNNIGMQ